MFTRALLGLFVVLFTLGGIAVGVAAAIWVHELGLSGGRSIAVGVLWGANAWFFAFVCAVLAGVHERVARHERELTAIADELWTDAAETTPAS